MTEKLKPGYKQTEVGVIPEEWGIEPLGGIGKWFSGGTPSMSNAAYWDGDVPWVSPKDMKVSRLYDAIDHISQKAMMDGTRLLPAGAVLMVVRGMILAHSFPVARAERPLAFNQDMKAVVTRDDVDSNFVLYWLSANEQRLRRLATESTHGTKRLPSETLFREKLLRPPLAEQRAIAAALGDVDALIGALDQLIAKKRDLKQAAMQQLLTGQHRLPGFHGEWETKRLGEIGEALIGLTYAPSNVSSDGLLVLRSSNIFEGRLQFNDNVYVNMDVSQKLMVKLGDILICARNGSRDLIGKCAIIDERAHGMTFGAFMAIFRTSFSQFVFYQFQSNSIRRQIQEHLGATINQITNKSLNSFQIPLPKDYDEQLAIASAISDMDAELAALEARREKTRELKQGMIQELLTGRIRLV